MRVLALTSPGRFPTVVHDPGLWWDAVSGSGRHQAIRYSANASWWRTICGAEFKQLALAPLGALDRLRRRAEWTAADIRLIDAADVLDRLNGEAPYRSASSYLSTLATLAQRLDDVNDAQREFNVGIAAGPRVNGLDYDDCTTLVRYAEAGSLLARSVAASLEACPRDIDVALLSVTSPEDLLTSLTAARVLRGRHAGIHLSLIDHGYENFSLHSTIADVARCLVDESGLFDTVIATKDERDVVVPALIEALSRGETPRGLLGSFSLPRAAAGARTNPPPPLPTFAPLPILWTRLSARRCYWSRCTYCSQNSKYDNPQAPARTEILQSLDRIEAAVAVGYRSFIFSDEALSPATLRTLADEIDRRGLDIRWACRCKLERAHTADLFERLGRSGCYEILYGLETTSARVLKLMDKHVEGLDEPAIARVFEEMERAGIGIHANLIAGYPGDTLADAERSVEFIAREFRRRRHCTYVLNTFALLADTPLANQPERHGIAQVRSRGNVAQECDYELPEAIDVETRAVQQAVPRLRERLDGSLGWAEIARQPGGRLAVELYFGSGHGAVFKTRADSPFANPLLAVAG